MEAKKVPSLSGAGGFDVVCRCLSGYQKRDHALGWWGRDTTCLEQTAYDAVKSYDTGSADTVTYRDLVGESGTKTVESKLLAQLLIASASGCRRAVQADVALPRGQSLLRGNEACQALANLCVLEMYDADAPSCELYREMQLASETEVNEILVVQIQMPLGSIHLYLYLYLYLSVSRSTRSQSGRRGCQRSTTRRAPPCTLRTTYR